MLIESIFPAQLGIYRSCLSPTQLSCLDSFSDERNGATTSQAIKKDYHGQNILDNPSLLELRAFIKRSADNFLINTFGTTNKLFISNSWINIAHSSASQPFHTHSNSLISGTFYISFDSSIHPSLLFRHPRPLCSFSSYEDMPVVPTRFNSPLYRPSYMQGDLLLWPSYLEHGFFPSPVQSKSDIPRVSLSFNINITNTLLHSYSLSFS